MLYYTWNRGVHGWYKIHTISKQSADLITTELIRAAGELNLTINIQKCGIYNKNQDDQEIDTFIPKVQDGYKYLGLYQLELDNRSNKKF